MQSYPSQGYHWKWKLFEKKNRSRHFHISFTQFCDIPQLYRINRDQDTAPWFWLSCQGRIPPRYHTVGHAQGRRLLTCPYCRTRKHNYEHVAPLIDLYIRFKDSKKALGDHNFFTLHIFHILLPTLPTTVSIFSRYVKKIFSVYFLKLYEDNIPKVSLLSMMPNSNTVL